MSNGDSNVAKIVTASQLSKGDRVNRKDMPAVIFEVKCDPKTLAITVDLMDPTTRFVTRDISATEVDVLWDQFFDRVSAVTSPVIPHVR